MPYFVYKVFPSKQVEELDKFPVYKEARNLARDLRKDIGEDDDYIVKVIFAGNPDEAQRLLTTEREARPMGEDA